MRARAQQGCRAVPAPRGLCLLGMQKPRSPSRQSHTPPAARDEGRSCPRPALKKPNTASITLFAPPGAIRAIAPHWLQPSLGSRLHLPTPKTQLKSSALCLPSSPGVREATSEIQGSEGRNAAGSEVREAEGRNFTSPHPFAPHEQQQSRRQRGGSQGQTPLMGRELGGAGQSPASSYSTGFWPGGCRYHLQCFSRPCWSVKVSLRVKFPKQSYSRKSRRD